MTQAFFQSGTVPVPVDREAVQEVRLCAPIDFATWASRYATGKVADRLPYGFDHLESMGLRVATRTVRRPRRSVRGLAPRPRPRPDDSDWAVTWDERSAVSTLQSRVRARRLATGLIWATDHVSRSERRSEMRVVRRHLRRFDVVWCLSRPQVELAIDWLRPSRGGGPRVEFVPFGINPESFAYAAYPESKLVLSVGNDPDRDPQATVDAMVAIRRADPEVTCVIQSKALDAVPPGITLIRSASHEEVQRLYRRASVVLIATRPNTHVSGMTVALEAQSVGRPVVMTHTVGVNDYLSPENAAVVPSGDARGLAARALELLDDQAGCEAIGRRGRQFVEQARTTALMMTSLRRLFGAPNAGTPPPTHEYDDRTLNA